MVTCWSHSTSNFYAPIGQNLTGELLWKIYTAPGILFAGADRVLCHLLMFLTVFFHCMYKMKYRCTKILLLFMAGLFIGFLVDKCTACQSFWKLAYSLHFAGCVRGLKSLKRFWPYLMAFSCFISTGKPEQLLYLMFAFFSGFMKLSVVYVASLCTFVRLEAMIWASIRFDISL